MKPCYVVALDGSPASELALEFACPMAVAAGADLVLAHVIEDSPPGKVHGQPHLPSSASAVTSYLEGVAARCTPVARTCYVPAGGRGLPASLAAVCAAENASLLFLSPHGPETGVNRWLLGSVAQRTAPVAPCPVFIARGAPDLENGKFRGVFIADDFTPEHETGWRRILAFGRLHAARVEIVGVIDPANVLPTNLSARFLPSACRELVEAARRMAPGHMAVHLSEIETLGIPVVASVLEGDRLDVMAAALSRRGAWPLILRTHGLRGLAARFAGSFAQSLLQTTSNPVLLVPIPE